jgi:hypothetical protein
MFGQTQNRSIEFCNFEQYHIFVKYLTRKIV